MLGAVGGTAASDQTRAFDIGMPAARRGARERERRGP
jgi:hypothetical protein